MAKHLRFIDCENMDVLLYEGYIRVYVLYMFVENMVTNAHVVACIRDL